MTQRHSQGVLLTVTEFARVCQTTARTIRFYEKLGLIMPREIASWNKYSYYIPQQARDVFLIKLLQKFDISLLEIKKLLKDSSKLSFEKELDRIAVKIEELQKEHQFLKEINALIFENKNFKSRVKREKIGPYTLFCKYIKNGDYHKIGDYIFELRSVADSLGLQYFDSEITFYLEYAYKPKNTGIEIAIVCRKQLRDTILPKNYYFKHFPKTMMLTLIYKGPYTSISLIHKRFDDYVEEENIKVMRPIFEQYLEHSLHTRIPYEYETKIGYPILS